MCVLNEIWCLCTLQHFKINHARFTSPSCLLELLRPPGTAPGRPPPPSAPRSPFFSSSPSPPPPAAGSRRSVGKETKREERRGREGQSCPSSPREGAGSVWGLPPRELRRVSAPPAAQGGGAGAEGVFSPLSRRRPAQTRAVLKPPRVGPGVGFTFKPGPCSHGLNSLAGVGGSAARPGRALPQTIAGTGCAPRPPLRLPRGGLSRQPLSPPRPSPGCDLRRLKKGYFHWRLGSSLSFFSRSRSHRNLARPELQPLGSGGSSPPGCPLCPGRGGAWRKRGDFVGWLGWGFSFVL